MKHVRAVLLAAAPAAMFLAGLVVSLGSLGGCRRSESKPDPTHGHAAAAPAPAPKPIVEALRVPRAGGPIKLDGELNEPAWNAIAARTGPFVDATGGEARPYSDARFMWDDENLYVSLYAADDDIRAKITAHDGPVWIDDSFTLHLTPATVGAFICSFDIGASGVVADRRRAPGGKDDVSWESGIKLGVDHDGTLNEPNDNDEEWVIEAAIPLRALGLEPKVGTRILVDISRCDTPRRTTEKRCGALGTPKDPRVLVLAP